ncbi:MAG TPA: DUF4147 domain-containing protein, partial [Planctomycetaceae bacterium]|nr:DUF4147 domain-containing protein [Planctomycetaceae bacterium]
NEPTEAGGEGTRKILELASSCGPRDLCLVLISGGGSALMPAPAKGVTLKVKQQVTRQLMLSGATINELNCVRKHLSDIKGGRLAIAARRAGRIVSLIISDVVGDPLDVIASGPTVQDLSTSQDAYEVLNRFGGGHPVFAEYTLSIVQARLLLIAQNLEQGRRDSGAEMAGEDSKSFPDQVRNFVIGNNDVALTAAAQEALYRGYAVYSLGSENEGDADDQGRALARLGLRILESHEPVAPPACVLSGGEPTVSFVPTEQPRKGGRNQQLALSALIELSEADLEKIVVISGGTDGEDGPTDAAGAIADANVLNKANQLGLEPAKFRDIQNAYPFFEATDGLLKTGPTNTNVMDLRIMLVGE